MADVVTMNAQSIDAWLDVLQQLMPQGEAWPRHIHANQTKLLRALAIHLSDLDAQSDAIQREMIPSLAHILLEEYERYLGLPECGEVQQTIQERRHAVEEKDKPQNAMAAWQIDATAANLGFDIKVYERFPHHCLRGCLTPLYPARYRHVLDIDVFTAPDSKFTCIDNILTPLTTGNRNPECALNRYKLAGKYYDYFYQETPSCIS